LAAIIDPVAVEETVRRCNAAMAEQIEAAEFLLRAHGATEAEVEAAVGPHGYARRMLQEDRDAQIREVTRWLAVGDDTLH
jgi:hypothetical protein